MKQQWKAHTKQTHHRPWLALTYPLCISKAIRVYCLWQVIFWIFNNSLFFWPLVPDMNVNIDKGRGIFQHLNSATGFSGTLLKKKHNLSEKSKQMLLPGPLSTEHNSRAPSLSHNVPRGKFFTGCSSERMRPWAVQPTWVLHRKHVTARSWWNLTCLRILKLHMHQVCWLWIESFH